MDLLASFSSDCMLILCSAVPQLVLKCMSMMILTYYEHEWFKIWCIGCEKSYFQFGLFATVGTAFVQKSQWH